MTVTVPSEAEIERRLRAHLAKRPDDPAIAVLWQGYLAALFEWGLIEVAAYDRLAQLLGTAGTGPLEELFLGPVA